MFQLEVSENKDAIFPLYKFIDLLNPNQKASPQVGNLINNLTRKHSVYS